MGPGFLMPGHGDADACAVCRPARSMTRRRRANRFHRLPSYLGEPVLPNRQGTGSLYFVKSRGTLLRSGLLSRRLGTSISRLQGPLHLFCPAIVYARSLGGRPGVLRFPFEVPGFARDGRSALRRGMGPYRNTPQDETCEVTIRSTVAWTWSG